MRFLALALLAVLSGCTIIIPPASEVGGPYMRVVDKDGLFVMQLIHEDPFQCELMSLNFYKGLSKCTTIPSPEVTHAISIKMPLDDILVAGFNGVVACRRFKAERGRNYINDCAPV